MRSANIAPDKRQLMELHRQYLEDPVIHDLCRQKIAILSVANKYAVVLAFNVPASLLNTGEHSKTFKK